MSSGEMPTIQPALSLIFPSLELDSKDKETTDPQATWHFFSHSVKRNPTNLKMHTHRIFFSIQHQNADYLPGALHDLFYILKDSGKNLRLRLLKASAPYLNESDKQYYAKWLSTGAECGMDYKWVKGSVLSPGLSNSDKALINKKSNKGSVSLSPLEEARACMGYGQLEVAQKILENALTLAPEDPQLKEELAYVSNYINVDKESRSNPNLRSFESKKEQTSKVGLSKRFKQLTEKLFN